MNKLWLVPLLTLLLSGSIVSASALIVEGRSYDFDWTYIGSQGSVDGVQVTAFTDDLQCDKVSFRYWKNAQHGDPDLENKNVPTVLVSGEKVAVDVQMVPDYCETWIIQVHFHTTSNAEGSVKVVNGVHVPMFENMMLTTSIAMGLGLIVKRRRDAQ